VVFDLVLREPNGVLGVSFDPAPHFRHPPSVDLHELLDGRGGRLVLASLSGSEKAGETIQEVVQVLRHRDKDAAEQGLEPVVPHETTVALSVRFPVAVEAHADCAFEAVANKLERRQLVLAQLQPMGEIFLRHSFLLLASIFD
jgi:hypothetical protein